MLNMMNYNIGSKKNGLSEKTKQALRNSCELLRRRKELHATHVTACKVIELHARSWNCMQAHVNAYKLL